MQSVVIPTFHYVAGGGRGYRVNVIDEHVGFIEGAEAIGKCLGNLLAGVYHGFSGQWAAIANDVKGLYENVAKGGDKIATATSNTVQQKGGQVNKISVVFKAFSEDEIKHTAFGKATPTAGVKKRGDIPEYFKRGDIYYYQCAFDLDLNAAPPGEYVFAFGACDDGWWSDIAVASTYSVFLNAADGPLASSPDPTRDQIHALQNEFVQQLVPFQRTGQKRTGARPHRIIMPTVYEVAAENEPT